MTRRVLMAAAVLSLWTMDAAAQLVPEGSQAARVDMGYRRMSSFRIDPFRHVMIPHWGFVFSFGATGENSAWNLADFMAYTFLDDSTNGSQVLPGDLLDVIGLIPVGKGVRVVGQAEGGFYLGGPFGRHLSLGFSAQSRAYGSGLISDGVVSLLRDGNLTQDRFDLLGSGGIGLATVDLGAHAVLRFGPLGTEDGMHLALGFGGRLVRAGLYYQARPQLGSSTVVRAGLDSIVADLSFETFQTFETSLIVADFLDRVQDSPTSVVGDFLIRMEWPTNGFTLEAMFANLGSVSIPNVVRDTASLSVATNDAGNDLKAAFDAMQFEFADSVDVDVKLPQIIRFSAGAWANRILQVDVAATMPVSGDFETPLTMDLGTTWRFVRQFPLRVGLILGGHQGLGYSGGFALEGRNVFFQVAGQSLGGLFRNAKGTGARVDFGIFF
ncbi:MAG: hypothetical protein IH878_07665 [Gemmatimonadetes bacterium]|nr:hypothetical protein [Gemmatimonadota bacterium]